jgi:hypothetical protein
MCFGSGSPKYKKPEFGALPSTRVSKKRNRKAPELKDVDMSSMLADERTGQKQRSLLNPNRNSDS